MSQAASAKWAADLRGCWSLASLDRTYARYMCSIFNRVGGQLFDAGEADALARELTRIYEERADQFCGVSHAGVSSPT